MRYRPNQDIASFCAMREVIDAIDPDTNRVVTQNFFPSEEKLPSVDNFDLQTMIKAGVPLQKTSTKVLGSGVQQVAELLNDDSYFSKPTNEVNNEQQ